MAKSLCTAALVTGKGKARGGRTGAASVSDAAMRASQVASGTNQGCGGPYAPFRRSKDHNDDDEAEDDEGLAKQRGRATRLPSDTSRSFF